MAALAELTASERITKGNGAFGRSDAGPQALADAVFTFPRDRGAQQSRIVADVVGHGAVGVSWRSGVSGRPAWLSDEVVRGLLEVLALPPDWDSYGSEGVRKETVEQGLAAAAQLLAAAARPPRVVPISGGGFQFEWGRRGLEMEWVFQPGDAPRFYFWDEAAASERAGLLSEQETVRDLLSRVG